MTNRHTRFWLLGAALILGNAAYIGYKLVKLQQPLTVAEMVFHGALILVAVSTFDKELGKYWADRISKTLLFWRKNGNGGPPPPAEAA